MSGINIDQFFGTNPSSLIQYVTHMGDDAFVCNMARVTMAKMIVIDVMGTMAEKDIRLLNYLARHKHTSPFYHPYISLRISAPIPIARQIMKHQIGISYNEVSRRIDTSDPGFFVPKAYRTVSRSIKQGSTDDTHPRNDVLILESQRLIKRALDLYNEFIEVGVCPEQARLLLPQSMMTTFVMTGSLYAFFHFYRLRYASNAQHEIRWYADSICLIMNRLYPNAWNALTTYMEAPGNSISSNICSLPTSAPDITDLQCLEYIDELERGEADHLNIQDLQMSPLSLP